MEPLGTGKLAAALGALVIDKLYPSTGTSNLIHWVMASACDRYIESVFRDVECDSIQASLLYDAR